MKRVKKGDVRLIKARFLEHFRDAKSELEHKNLYELLVAVMLSAQCTDKRVNIITPALFAHFPDIKSLASADIEEVKNLINSCSFFNNKAKNLIAMANQVLEFHGGEIPLLREDLVALAGVGQKTANVVLGEHLGENLIAVDTHVFRVSHRLGLSSAKTPKATEEDLTKLFKSDLSALHQAFVLFGRYTCKAQKPLCEVCFIEEFCQSRQNFKI